MTSVVDTEPGRVGPGHKLALSLMPRSLEHALSALHGVRERVQLAEVRVDRWSRAEVVLLVQRSPLPLIVTCRPPREGGSFEGPESERLALLHAAAVAGAAYVDVEWDSSARLLLPEGSLTRRIVSRHFAHMPESLLAHEAELRPGADVVKLVGRAAGPLDLWPIFELLAAASGPVIALAMGDAGEITRVLAPTFERCFVTYGALSAEQVTAPGQLPLDELLDAYHLTGVDAATAVHLHVCRDRAEARAWRDQNRRGERQLHVGWVLPEGLNQALSEAARSRPSTWRLSPPGVPRGRRRGERQCEQREISSDTSAPRWITEG
ncbi:MAG TPA: type I 3-dehydroquinate dehydratase [Polyangiaceae bacterium]|nr:type I 3-dehydroquinate dehydratase [Polyangiaceae bacterium]